MASLKWKEGSMIVQVYVQLLTKNVGKYTLRLPDLMDKLGKTYGVRKCEEMWSLGTDRPGTPCAVKVHSFGTSKLVKWICTMQDVDGLWYRARLEKVIRCRIVKVSKTFPYSIKTL